MGRPLPTFRDFVGQRPAVRMLRRQLEGAKRLGEPHPHTAMMGPSGLGKTQLSLALASEFGTELFRVNGGQPMDEVVDTLMRVEHGDFCFIDEAQAMKIPTQEMLLHAIDELEVPNPAARRGSAKKAPPTSTTTPKKTSRTKSKTTEAPNPYVQIQPFTLVLATNQPGMLCDALMKRIEVHVTLNYYSDGEMQAITDRLAADNGILLSSHARNLVARVADGIPRRARHLVTKLRRHFCNLLDHQIELPQVRQFLEAIQLDERGLGPLKRRYLAHLAAEKTASLESLTLVLGSDQYYVRSEIESRLQRMRFIRIGSGGRQLTELGRLYRADATKNQPGNTEDDDTESGKTAY